MFENTVFLVKENKKYLFPLLLQIGLMTKIQELMGIFGLLGLIISFFLLTVSHAEVVGGLNVVFQKEKNMKEDVYCGFKRYKELFSTYFWLMIIKMLIALVIGYFISWIFFNAGTTSFWNEIFLKVEEEMQFGIQDTAQVVIGIGAFIIFIASLFTDYMVKSLFFLAPYLLETQKVTGFKAIKSSWKMLQGHRKEVFKLQTHYFLYIVLFSCLYYFINQTPQLLLLSPFLSIGLVFVEVHLYRMEYAVSKAQLFKKIMNERLVP